MRDGSKKRWGGVVLAAALTFGVTGVAGQSMPTDVVVRAVAHDAKVVGSSVGGARITIRDAETGDTLAEGVQEGGTGDTDRIMRQPRERGATVYDTPDAASFRTTLHLEEPTLVEVTAEGPLGPRRAARTASRTLLLLPGRDVTGQGIVLTLQGLVVRLRAPEGDDRIRSGGSIPVRATVEMMCGCPVTPGGLWDADDMEITARLVLDGQTVSEIALAYVGEPSTFEGKLPAPPGPGEYELLVSAAQPDAGNFGVARRGIRVADAD